MTVIVDAPNLMLRLIHTLDAAQVSLQERLMEFVYWESRYAHCLVFVWEGVDSVKRRRKLLSSYKEGRGAGPKKKDNIDEKFFFDLAKEFLTKLNVPQLSVPGLEADDVIAYLTRRAIKPVVVISEDKDFYQLLTNEKVTLKRPRAKITFKHDNLVEHEGVIPENFLLCKAICGDPSDNIKGIASVNIKRLVHYFPALAEKPLTLQELMKLPAEEKFAKELQRRMAAADDIIDRNLKLVTLDTSTITSVEQSKIEYQMGTHGAINFTSQSFQKLLVDEGIRVDFEHYGQLYFTFNKIAKARLIL